MTETQNNSSLTDSLAPLSVIVAEIGFRQQAMDSKLQQAMDSIASNSSEIKRVLSLYESLSGTVNDLAIREGRMDDAPPLPTTTTIKCSLDEVAAVDEVKPKVTITVECSGDGRLTDVDLSKHVWVKDIKSEVTLKTIQYDCSLGLLCCKVTHADVEKLVSKSVFQDENRSDVSCLQGVCRNAHEKLVLYYLPAKPPDNYLYASNILDLDNTVQYDVYWVEQNLRTQHGTGLSSIQPNLTKTWTYSEIYTRDDLPRRTLGFGKDKQIRFGNNKDIVCVVKALEFEKLRFVAGGSRNSLAICVDVKLFTWGWNQRGTLGHLPETKTENVPSQVKALVNVKVVRDAIAGWYGLAVDEQGRAYAWGGNEYIQCGEDIMKLEVNKDGGADVHFEALQLSDTCVKLFKEEWFETEIGAGDPKLLKIKKYVGVNDEMDYACLCCVAILRKSMVVCLCIEVSNKDAKTLKLCLLLKENWSAHSWDEQELACLLTYKTTPKPSKHIEYGDLRSQYNSGRFKSISSSICSSIYMSVSLVPDASFKCSLILWFSSPRPPDFEIDFINLEDKVFRRMEECYALQVEGQNRQVAILRSLV